jgi:hypothetical protein
MNTPDLPEPSTPTSTPAPPAGKLSRLQLWAPTPPTLRTANFQPDVPYIIGTSVGLSTAPRWPSEI